MSRGWQFLHGGGGDNTLNSTLEIEYRNGNQFSLIGGVTTYS